MLHPNKDKHDLINLADESDGMNILPGQCVTSNEEKYTILKKLGQGGYGAVYKVQDEQNGLQYAMKVEKKTAKREHSKLNMEIYILNSMMNQPEEQSHYAQIFDKAKKQYFYMIIMTLLGPSLADLKRRRNPSCFTLNTGYSAAIQCLEAIEELHNIGFLHRDIKAANYAIGSKNMKRKIYIIDFGIARRIINDKNEIKAPRIKVPFKGTVRFAPLASHRNKELSYKDDCESWLYMVVDMCNRKGLPWKSEKEKNIVGNMKEKIRSVPNGVYALFYGMAVEEFTAALDYITKLNYTDKVIYSFLIQCIQKAAQRNNCSLLPPYDWEVEGEVSSESVSSYNT